MSYTQATTQLDFFDHAEELRRRLLYCLAAIVIAMVAGWLLYPTLYRMLADPIIESVRSHGGIIVTSRPADAFFIRLRVTGIFGIALASPVVLWQLWAFIRPGLTPRERHAITPVIPMVCVLFLIGAAVAYLFLPQVMNFFLAYVPHGVKAYIDFTQSIDLPMKLILAFGLAFQLPIVLLGLVWLQVLNPATLRAQWRVALVIIAILAAVITPTGDPVNMSLMMIPMIVLYFATVLFAYRMQKRQGRK